MQGLQDGVQISQGKQQSSLEHHAHEIPADTCQLVLLMVQKQPLLAAVVVSCKVTMSITADIPVEIQQEFRTQRDGLNAAVMHVVMAMAGMRVGG